MKLRLLAIIIGASSALALAACSSETDDGDAGDGGAGATGADGGAGVGATGGDATGATGGEATGATGGTGGASDCGADGPDACNLCSQVITFGCSPDELCEPESGELYDALVACVCVDSCATECADFCMPGGEQSAECSACITDSCDTEAGACGNDA